MKCFSLLQKHTLNCLFNQYINWIYGKSVLESQTSDSFWMPVLMSVLDLLNPLKISLHISHIEDLCAQKTPCYMHISFLQWWGSDCEIPPSRPLRKNGNKQIKWQVWLHTFHTYMFSIFIYTHIHIYVMLWAAMPMVQWPSGQCAQISKKPWLPSVASWIYGQKKDVVILKWKCWLHWGTNSWCAVVGTLSIDGLNQGSLNVKQ